MRLIDADHLISILKEYIKREESYISICNNPILAKGIERGLQEAVRTVNKEPTANTEQKHIDQCDTCEYNSLDWHEEPCESCTGADNHWKPPTQSNTSKALEALDCISRAAAIDAIQAEADEAKEVWSEFDDESAFGQMNAHSRDIDIIKRLPSAQPETAKRIVGKSRDGMTLWYQCDMCNEPVDAHDIFCRGCGRRLIDE